MSFDLETRVPNPEEMLPPVSSGSLQTDTNPLNILLVEDSAGDALLTRASLNAIHMPYTLHTLQKGNQVLPHLMACWKRGRATLPDVIMLDLGLPGLDGFEVLSGLSHAPAAVRAVPIVILTGHQYFDDIGKDYNLCIPAYIKKPCSPEEIRKILTGLRRHRPKF